MVDHPTKTLTMPGTGDPVEVDEQLADIIRLLWHHDVLTLQCCQHDPFTDSAWIQFGDSSDAATFARLLFETSDDGDELLQRQREWEVATPEPSASRRAWRWKAAPRPIAFDGYRGEWDFDVMVEFPPDDIAEVERRLRGIA